MDMTKAKFNVERFSKSDFSERFLDFNERYEDVVRSGEPEARDFAITAAKTWVDNRYDYYIRAFLDVGAYEYRLPFSMDDFANMNVPEFLEARRKAKTMCAILAEKKALYEEFLTFYDE